MEFPLVWTEIDLSAIGQNVKELCRITNKNAKFMAVVKANAYGHGAIETALTALENGADLLGVARIQEGIQLRKAGINAPVLILGHTPPNLASELIKWRLTQTVIHISSAEKLSDAAQSPIKVHLKVDTGMGRLGVLSYAGNNFMADAVKQAKAVARLQNLVLEGVFTHFASADETDASYTKIQFERFMDFLNYLKKQGIEIPVRHCANSAAIIGHPDTHLDMVRAGIALYGLYPSDEIDKNRVNLKPAMSFKTRIIHLKQVPAGFKSSYGMTWQTSKPTTLATVSAGYADGLSRLLSSRGHMLVRGQRANIAGRICMDLTMLDVGHIPDAAVGDEVVIFGQQENTCLQVDEIASLLNTIHYEIVSTITSRVPRIYLKK